MNPGELRHRIKIQKHTSEMNENGFEVKSWQDFKSAWASVTNLHGREFFQAKQVSSSASTKFIIRYIDELDTKMRILYNDKHYNIIYIDNIKDRNRFIELLCEVIE